MLRSTAVCLLREGQLQRGGGLDPSEYGTQGRGSDVLNLGCGRGAIAALPSALRAHDEISVVPIVGLVHFPSSQRPQGAQGRNSMS